ncbi:MAG: hypothetical protein QXQ96_10490 [Sulfolobales archaeon]
MSREPRGGRLVSLLISILPEIFRVSKAQARLQRLFSEETSPEPIMEHGLIDGQPYPEGTIQRIYMEIAFESLEKAFSEVIKITRSTKSSEVLLGYKPILSRGSSSDQHGSAGK